MQVGDWVGTAIIIGLVFCGLFALARLSRPCEISADEYERRVKEGPGAIGAGLIEIQKILDPAAEKAAEVREDFKAGHLDGEQESGEGEDKSSETKDSA